MNIRVQTDNKTSERRKLGPVVSMMATECGPSSTKPLRHGPKGHRNAKARPISAKRGGGKAKAAGKVELPRAG